MHTLISYIVDRMAAGRLGQECEHTDDRPELRGVIEVDFVDTSGVCAAEGANYWSFHGKLETFAHGIVILSGLRTEEDASGKALSCYPYARKYRAS